MSEDARVLCEWIDKTIALPVYQKPARDSYAEGVVDTLKTVRKLLSRDSARLWPCLTCGALIRVNADAGLGEPRYVHVTPAGHLALRGPDHEPTDGES